MIRRPAYLRLLVMMVVFTTLSLFSQGQNCCPPASTATPVVDGKLDASYQFFKNIKLSVPLNNLYSRATIYKFEDATTLYLAFVESRAVNDNVYGPLLADVSYAGWGNPKLHKFSDLLGSDKLQLQLYNQTADKVFDVTFDYLFQQTVGGVVSYNSGLIKFMPSGGTTPKYEGSLSTAPVTPRPTSRSRAARPPLKSVRASTKISCSRST